MDKMRVKACRRVMCEHAFAAFLQRPTLSALLRLQGELTWFWRKFGESE